MPQSKRRVPWALKDRSGSAEQKGEKGRGTSIVGRWREGAETWRVREKRGRGKPRCPLGAGRLERRRRPDAAPRRWGHCRAACNSPRAASSIASSTDRGPWRPESLSSSHGPQRGLRSRGCMHTRLGVRPTSRGRCASSLRFVLTVCRLPVLCSLFAPLCWGPGKAEAPGVFLFSWKLRELMCATYFSVFHKTHNCVI